jgi:hypothetical protein
LQGGFAFYSWFSGQHAGDFVTTLGGYSPLFHPPKHYPAVPRLGFNWQVTPQVLIKGAAYFAMTPHAIMAGGCLSATFDGGDVHAWFVLGADFLMYWKPFHYIASAEVEIGAALTVHCFGTHHITITAGAELQIWGPPFAGQAHVHVKVLIVHISFTVSFGEGSPTPPPKIAWDDFQKTFLPEPDKSPEKLCNVAIQGGLVRTLKDQQGKHRWIVNSKELCLVTDGLIPSTEAGFLDDSASDGAWNEPKPAKQLGDVLKSRAAVTGLGIEPMGIERTKWTSRQVLRIRKQDPERDGTVDVSADFLCLPHFKPVPCALWNPDASPTSSPGVNQPRMIQALTGYQLHPAKPPTPGKTCFIRDDHLQYQVTPRDLAGDKIARVTYRSPQPETKVDPRRNLHARLADPQAIQRRQNLLDQLGFTPARDVAIHESLVDALLLLPRVVTAAAE